MLPQNSQVPLKTYSLYLGGCHFNETFLQNKGLKLMLKMNSVTQLEASCSKCCAIIPSVFKYSSQALLLLLPKVENNDKK